MSAGSAAAQVRTNTPKPGTKDFERRHLLRLRALYGIAIAFLVALSVYGLNYYRLGVEARPFSEKHHLLRPSGPIGLYAPERILAEFVCLVGKDFHLDASSIYLHVFANSMDQCFN